jgi:hypothetical protein
MWGCVGGRLLAMLEGEASLTLEQLNVASINVALPRKSPQAFTVEHRICTAA